MTYVYRGLIRIHTVFEAMELPEEDSGLDRHEKRIDIWLVFEGMILMMTTGDNSTAGTEQTLFSNCTQTPSTVTLSSCSSFALSKLS